MATGTGPSCFEYKVQTYSISNSETWISPLQPSYYNEPVSIEWFCEDLYEKRSTWVSSVAFHCAKVHFLKNCYFPTLESVLQNVVVSQVPSKVISREWMARPKPADSVALVATVTAKRSISLVISVWLFRSLMHEAETPDVNGTYATVHLLYQPRFVSMATNLVSNFTLFMKNISLWLRVFFSESTMCDNNECYT